jgi:hypothetical protein
MNEFIKRQHGALIKEHSDSPFKEENYPIFLEYSLVILPLFTFMMGLAMNVLK